MFRQFLQVSALIWLSQVSRVGAVPDAAAPDVDPIYVTVEAAPVYKTIKSIVATEYVTINGQVYTSTVYSTAAVTTADDAEPTSTTANLLQTASLEPSFASVTPIITDLDVSTLTQSPFISSSSSSLEEFPVSSTMALSLSLDSAAITASSPFSSSVISSSSLETSSSVLTSSSASFSTESISSSVVEFLPSPTSSPANSPSSTAASSPTSESSSPTSSSFSTSSSSTSIHVQSLQAKSTSLPSNSEEISIIVPSAIVYSPYTNSGQCKDQDTVTSDLQLIASKGIKEVRVYATDCNSLQTVQPAAADLSMKVNQGFWMDASGVNSIDNQVSDLLDYAKDNGWDIFTRITIGNEAILQNFCTPAELMDKSRAVSSQLRAAGYGGPIMTAEPPVTFTKNPELCNSGVFDQIGINSHSYFNTEIDASQAGPFVADQLAMIEKTCNVPVFVTETGYPSAGNVNGKNVPSQENQSAAVSSLLQNLNGECTLLTTYDDLWKNPGPYNIEQHFGLIYRLA